MNWGRSSGTPMSTRTVAIFPSGPGWSCRFLTTRGPDRDFGPVRHAVVIDVFSDTADAVAAHLRLRAVEIIQNHLEISDIGRTDADEAVAANAEVAVRNPAREGRTVVDLSSKQLT